MVRPEISLVIPIYNEEEVLPALGERLAELCGRLGADTTWEVVFVDDGSKDRSLELLRGAAGIEKRYRVVSFSRNFGHQRAITAGVDAARGKAVVVMDADLQDPPEVVLEMVARWRDGFDVVYGRRRSREGESAFKLVTAKLFYRLFAAMIPIEVPLDTGDFRLMSRRVVMTMRGLRETHRFVRGLVAWAGFKQTAVEYDRAARAAGTTKYPLRKMVSFALDGIASFSILPLRAATYLGVIVGLVSIVYAIAATITYVVGVTVPGWTTTVVLVSFLFSVQLVMTGVLGEYIGRIYEQVKRRPLYIVAERINFKRARRRKGEPAAEDETPLAAPAVNAFALASPTPSPPPSSSIPLVSSSALITEPLPTLPPSSEQIKTSRPAGPPPPLPAVAAAFPQPLPTAGSTSPPPLASARSAPPPKVSAKPPPPLPTKTTTSAAQKNASAPPPVAGKEPLKSPSVPPGPAAKPAASTPPPASSNPSTKPSAAAQPFKSPSVPPTPAVKPAASTPPPASSSAPSSASPTSSSSSPPPPANTSPTPPTKPAASAPPPPSSKPAVDEPSGAAPPKAAGKDEK